MTKDVKKIKKLTQGELKKQVKKLNAVEKFYVSIDDEMFEITYDSVFRKTKQQKVIEDLVEFFDAGRFNTDLFEVATTYTTLLIIKHFTSLDIPDDIDEALTFMNLLIDLEIFDKTLNALPEDEVEKIYELLTSVINNMKANIEEAEKEAEALSDKIENQQVKEMITDGVKE